MKKLFAFLLILSLLAALAGCRAVDRAEDAIEHKLDAAENAVEQAVADAVRPQADPAPSPQETVPAPENTPVSQLSAEQAQQIALEHAGFTADQVTYLRADYEIDDGIPQYEVEFHQDRWEYDYEIHAEDGTILSYDKDD